MVGPHDNNINNNPDGNGNGNKDEQHPPSEPDVQPDVQPDGADELADAQMNDYDDGREGSDEDDDPSLWRERHYWAGHYRDQENICRHLEPAARFISKESRPGKAYLKCQHADKADDCKHWEWEDKAIARRKVKAGILLREVTFPSGTSPSNFPPPRMIVRPPTRINPHVELRKYLAAERADLAAANSRASRSLYSVPVPRRGSQANNTTGPRSIRIIPSVESKGKGKAVDHGAGPSGTGAAGARPPGKNGPAPQFRPPTFMVPRRVPAIASARPVAGPSNAQTGAPPIQPPNIGGQRTGTSVLRPANTSTSKRPHAAANGPPALGSRSPSPTHSPSVTPEPRDEDAVLDEALVILRQPDSREAAIEFVRQVVSDPQIVNTPSVRTAMQNILDLECERSSYERRADMLTDELRDARRDASELNEALNAHETLDRRYAKRRRIDKPDGPSN